jgi:hypothetical protein
MVPIRCHQLVNTVLLAYIIWKLYAEHLEY